MTQIRAPKKSETLEVRLPYPTKQAFMARCRDDGRSASEAVRSFIEAEIAAPCAPRRGWPLVLAGLIALAVGAAAAPALARASSGFDHLDADRDGQITAAELMRLDADQDGAVSRAEYDR